MTFFWLSWVNWVITGDAIFIQFNSLILLQCSKVIYKPLHLLQGSVSAQFVFVVMGVGAVQATAQFHRQVVVSEGSAFHAQ